MVWLIGLALAAISTAQAGAELDRFAYKLEMTPQEAHVDPAIEARYTARFQACQKHAVATPEVANCFETEFARQDLVLNREWKTTLHRIDPAHRAALI